MREMVELMDKHNVRRFIGSHADLAKLLAGAKVDAATAEALDCAFCRALTVMDGFLEALNKSAADAEMQRRELVWLRDRKVPA